MSEETVPISGVRTAVGRFGRAFKDVSAVKLGATVIKEAVKRTGNSLPGRGKCRGNDC